MAGPPTSANDPDDQQYVIYEVDVYNNKDVLLLMAVDSAVMIIDSAKGIEEQTLKLFKVCRMSGIPIFTFINKLGPSRKTAF